MGGFAKSGLNLYDLILKNIRMMALVAGVLLLLGAAAGSGYPFGSKVLANASDIGRPLFSLSLPVAVAYWDVGTAGYDEEDPVYLHIGSSDCDVINANDIRLTSIGSLSAGSKVKFNDTIDMNRPLKKLPCDMVYLDIYGSSAYDLKDPVYIHHYGQGDYEITCVKMDGFKERLPFSGKEIPVKGMSYAAFTDGYRLFIFDKLISGHPEKVGQWRGLDIELLRGLYSDYYHICGTWLVRIQSHKIGAADDGLGRDGAYGYSGGQKGDIAARLLITNDIRLSGYDAGTKINDYDPDQNKLTASPALARFVGPASSVPEIGYFDGNGNNRYDGPDDLYLNIPSGDSRGAVAVNNLRLSVVAAFSEDNCSPEQ